MADEKDPVEQRRAARKRAPAGESKPRQDEQRTPNGEQPPPAKPATMTPADRKLAEAVAGMYQGAGMLLIGVAMRVNDEGLQGTGIATVNHADVLALAWVDLANKNPAVKKALKRATEASAVGSLIFAHIPLMLPLLVDRGVVPGELAAMMGAMNNGGHTAG